MYSKTPADFPAKILIVDDKEENLLALQAILEDENATFVKASSGEDALRILLKETDFTLIILDVVMPRMDGFQTAQYIGERENLGKIPIIFLTAKDREENTFKAYNLGAADYISKPVDPELLRAKVRVFIELDQQRQLLNYQKGELISMNEELENEIRERKASEEKVSNLNKELEKKLEELESLDAFTYSVSHDLKNPLYTMSMVTELMKMTYGDKMDEDGMKLIDKMNVQIKKLNQFINDLLLFSRHGHILQKQETDMNEVVNSVLDEVRLSMDINGRYHIKVNELPTATCDSNLIRQVWSNLISNAIKYSSKEAQPEISIEHVETGAGSSVYCVKDNGIGFDMSEADQLFKVFQRLQSAKKFEGTGVGLAIVKKIIDGHGGRIWCESKPEVGTSFFFSV